MAAIAGQIVCSIGSPAWEFPECSFVFWLVLGLGMAVAGAGQPVAPPAETADIETNEATASLASA
jgi:hypothetical protein